MKKIIAFFAAAVAFACMAAVVVPFSPADGGVVKLGTGGKLTRVEAFSPVSGGTVALKSIYAAKVYTNAIEITVVTNVSYRVVETNYYMHTVFTNDFPNLSFEDYPGILSVATNVAVSAVTNVWPVFKETLAVTNSIVSGTQSGYTYTNSLASPVYLAPGERLLFTGTGVGGFVRLIFE